MPELGDKPIQPEYISMMNALMRVIDNCFNGDDRSKPRTTGVIMLVFPYGEKEGRCNYISNGANRDDVKIMLREQLARFEGQPEITGHG